MSSILHLVLINDDLRVINSGFPAARPGASQPPGSMPVMMMMAPPPPPIPYPTKSSLSSKLFEKGKSVSGKGASSKPFAYSSHPKLSSDFKSREEYSPTAYSGLPTTYDSVPPVSKSPPLFGSMSSAKSSKTKYSHELASYGLPGKGYDKDDDDEGMWSFTGDSKNSPPLSKVGTFSDTRGHC